MQALSSHHPGPGDPPGAAETGPEPAVAPTLSPEIVCDIVNRLHDTRSLAMLGCACTSYRMLTLPMLRFLDPMVRHGAGAGSPPPQWLLTLVAGQLCRLALARSHRQPERQARLTVAAVLAQVAQLRDARQRAIALDGQALRHIVWVADHGEDVPKYFGLVFALTPALCMERCAELLQAPPLRMEKAGELSVARGKQAPDYYLAIETRFIEQIRAATKPDAKPNQPGQALRMRALKALLPGVVARFCTLRMQHRAYGERLVRELCEELQALVQRFPHAPGEARQAAPRKLLAAILRYLLQHAQPGAAKETLSQLRVDAEACGCVDAKAWDEMVDAISTEIARSQKPAEPPETTDTAPGVAGRGPGMAALASGNAAHASAAAARQ